MTRLSTSLRLSNSKMSAQWFGNLHEVPYNSLSSALELRQSVISTNEGHRLRDAGAMDEAEERLKQALAAKQAYPGPANVSAAISHDNLGRVQLQMGKLDEAEANFRKALEIRKDMKGEEWDNAVTRENLAQVLEAKGNLEGAKEVRLSYGDKSVCCANYKVLDFYSNYSTDGTDVLHPSAPSSKNTCLPSKSAPPAKYVLDILKTFSN